MCIRDSDYGGRRSAGQVGRNIARKATEEQRFAWQGTLPVDVLQCVCAVQAGKNSLHTQLCKLLREGIDLLVFIFMDDRHRSGNCLLYTSDAADDLLCVDLGGRRIIKKKKQIIHIENTSQA